MIPQLLPVFSLAALFGLCGARATDSCALTGSIPSRLFFECPEVGPLGSRFYCIFTDWRLSLLLVAKLCMAWDHLDGLLHMD